MGAKHNLVLQKLVDNDLSLTPINKCLTPEEESIITSKEFEDAYYATTIVTQMKMFPM